jgi:hypothetical protein
MVTLLLSIYNIDPEIGMSCFPLEWPLWPIQMDTKLISKVVRNQFKYIA